MARKVKDKPMTTVQSLTPAELAARLGVPEHVCQAFLAATLRRAPEAQVSFGESGDRPWMRVDLPHGYALDMAVEDDGVTIGGHDGGFPGSQFFYYLIPTTADGQINRRCDKYTTVLAAGDDLYTKMYEGLSEVFGAIRQAEGLSGNLVGKPAGKIRKKRSYSLRSLIRA